MSVTAPVHARVMPIGPSTDDPDNFDAQADAWVAEVRPFGVELNALSDNVFANATDAAASASSAGGAKTAAETARDLAQGYKDAAMTYRDTAMGYRDAAQDFAIDAQGFAAASANSATGLTATSTTSFAVGNGSKAFIVPAGKQFPVGAVLSVTSIGDSSLRMFGPVASYSGSTLTLTINKSQGSGTAADWVIAPAGADGATGGTAGGQLTGALDELKGVSPASSATPDIWAAGGNYVPITQTAAITGFPNAPQPGASRTLFIINGAPIVNGANLFVRGGSRNLQPGDRVTIEADTVSTFSATIERGTGLPVSSLSFLRAEIYLASATPVAKITGPHRAILVGPGGSGARVSQAAGYPGSGSQTVSATGGGAGGMCIKDYDAVAGATYTFLAGTPGAAPSTANSNGNAGSASTYSGAGVALTANGGAGGTFSNNTVAQLSGAVGGTASGGDYNYQGGSSGYCAANVIVTGGNYSAQATGGGSVSWKGQVLSSGNIVPATTNNSNAMATGGAGVGGGSGNITGANGGAYSTGGGGSFAPSADRTTVGAGTVGAGMPLMTLTPLNLIGDGSGAASGQGGGSPGQASTAAPATSVAAGALAGSGAAATATLNTSSPATVGAPGLGAGSGGAACVAGSTTSVPAGGGSFMIILS